MILEKRQRSPESFLKESCIVSVNRTRISTSAHSFIEIWGQQRSEESSACGAIQKTDGAMQRSTHEYSDAKGIRS